MRELKNISITYAYNRIGKGSEKGNRTDTKDAWLHAGQLRNYTGEKLVRSS